MQEPDIAGLTQHALWAAFFLAVALGAITQRTHFCTMGAVADVVNMGDWTRARMWAAAVGTAAAGFGLMAGLGWIDPAASFYTAPKLSWLSYLVGGLMFGFGMVLASGCGNKTLVRVGSGNLKSLVVLLVLGLSAYMTLRGITAVARDRSVDQVFATLPGGQDLPALLSGGEAALRRQLYLWLGLGVGVLAWAWTLSQAQARRLDVVVGGLGVGAVVAGLWWVSGAMAFVPEHPDTLEPAYLASSSRAMESFSFVAPVAYLLDWLIWFSDKNKLLTIGVVTPLGVVLGAWVVALWTRRFRWEGFANVRDLGNHLVGAVLMGVGGVTAAGCTIGQGLSGLSTLALGSVIATVAIIAGCVAALRFQLWQLERQA